MNRPYITKVHIMLEIVSVVICVAALLVTIVYAAVAPAQVPTHYDLSGKPNGWGSAWASLILPVIMLVTIVSMIGVVHFVPADKWNTGVSNLRPSRRNLVYADIVMMIVQLDLEMALFTLAFAIGTVLEDSRWFIAATLIMVVLMTASIIVNLVRANRHNRQ